MSGAIWGLGAIWGQAISLYLRVRDRKPLGVGSGAGCAYALKGVVGGGATQIELNEFKVRVSVHGRRKVRRRGAEGQVEV
jgi:hypothetical protein